MGNSTPQDDWMAIREWQTKSVVVHYNRNIIFTTLDKARQWQSLGFKLDIIPLWT